MTIGLIGCNWGGTSATAWISRETIAAEPQLLPYLADYDNAMEGKTLEEHLREYDAYLAYQSAWDAKCGECYAENPKISWKDVQAKIGPSRYPGPMGPKSELRPGGLYEAMLQRVCPYSLRGFLYYQGESDDHRPDTYALLLSTLIRQWRHDWNDADMPFLIVQLPMFQYSEDPDYKHWCKIRAAQEQVWRSTQNTGLAVTLDCGEFDNIHPRDKSQVGYRLALQAFCEVYGMIRKKDAYSPILRDHVICGREVKLHYDFAEDGFVWQGEPCGFELAGADGVWHSAEAVLGINEITLKSDAVPAPLHARYAWTNFMQVTLYGRNHLPAAPFSTAP